MSRHLWLVPNLVRELHTVISMVWLFLKSVVQRLQLDNRIIFQLYHLKRIQRLKYTVTEYCSIIVLYYHTFFSFDLSDPVGGIRLNWW